MARPREVPDPRPRRLRVRFLDTVKPVNVEWFWPGWLPRGKPCLLTGDGGAGKSTILFDLAARVTTGRPFPEQEDDEDREPGTVLYIGVEDGLQDTVAPRLIAAGADRSRFGALYYPIDEEGISPQFTIPRDVPLLRQHIIKHEAELCLIDPITAFLSEKVESNGDAPVRRALSALSALSEETECTILMILHFNKKSGQKAQHRATASPAFVNLCRVVMAATDDPENVGLSVLTSVKNNIARKPRSLSYEVRDCAFMHGRVAIETSHIEWLGESDVSADQAVGAEGHDARKEAPIRTAIKELLLEILAEGPRVSSQVIAELEEHGGYSKRTIQDTAKRMGVKTKRVYDERTGKVAHHLWVLETGHAASGPHQGKRKYPR
jgi:hypothetical protein